MATPQGLRKSDANIMQISPPGPSPNTAKSILLPSEYSKRLKLQVTNWLLQVSLRGNIPLDKVKDLTTLFNHLRDGLMLCKILNVLHPGAISVINEDISGGTIPALDNLSKFAGGCTAFYGIDRRYMFRALDFWNMTPKGEEGMVNFLAALAIRASEKGYSVNFPINEARELLDACMKESETTASYLKLKVADSKTAPVGPSTTLIGLAASMDSLERSRKVSARPPPPPTQAPMLSSSSAATHKSDPIKMSYSTSINSLSTNIHAGIPLLTASPNSISSSSTLSLSQDPSVVLPKLTKKLEKLARNQKMVFERVDLALLKAYPKLSDNIRANYEICTRRLMNCESSQRELMDAFIDFLLPGTSIDFEGEVSLKRDSGDTTASVLSSPTLVSPKAFSKLPPEIVAAGLPKQELMRLSVVYEMIETEQDFARDLTVMITFHKVQLKTLKLMSDEGITTLFSNTEELVTVSQTFHDKMAERKTANAFIEEIGDIIAECSESLKAYSTYCSNYPIAMQMVHALQSVPEIKEQVQSWMGAPECRGLSLESFLIKPIQRICKYPLLLKELLRHTEKSHKDYPNLLIAAEKIDAVVKVANEATALLGERERIASIQNKIESTSPLYLTDKKLFKDANASFQKQNKKPADRYLVLCGDILAVCKIVNRSRYMLETMYFVCDLSMRGTDVAPPTTLQQQLQLQPKGKFGLTITISNGGAGEKNNTFTIYCNSEDEHKKWTDAFDDAIKANPPDPNRSRSNKRTSTQSLGGSAATFRQKFGQNFLSRMATNQSFDISGDHQEIETKIPEDPEMVEFDGQHWKRTLAATGQNYYYNIVSKDTRWKLPEVFVVVDAVTLKPIVIEDKTKQTTDEQCDDNYEIDEDDEDMAVEPYGNQWRKVTKGNGELVYYYHEETLETKWNPPEMTE